MGAMSGARWLDKLAGLDRRYYAVDGGGGATLLAQLPAADPRLSPVTSPRHADILLVVEPVTAALLGVIAEVYRQMPSPRRVVVVGPRADHDGAALSLEHHLPVAVRVNCSPAAPASPAAVAEAARRAPATDGDEITPLAEVSSPDEQFVPLRPVAEREIATEDLIMSFGPVQPATAGPLQLVLTMDGEQVVRADIRSGLARRGIEEAQTAMRWNDLRQGATIDPLAPVAGRFAWTEAVEHLHGIVPSTTAERQRAFALQIERAAGQFIWLTRFADLMGFHSLTDEARRLAATAAAYLPAATAAPRNCWYDSLPPRGRAWDDLDRLAQSAYKLVSRIERNRLFAARTRDVGVLSAERASAAGASGAVLHASESGAGDARSRVLSRLAAAAADLANCAFLARSAAGGASRAEHSAIPDSPPPAGTAVVHAQGPRGVVTLALESSGGERPTRIRWRGPSRAHLTLVAELVVGHTVPELLVCVASLDLSMAEADG